MIFAVHLFNYSALKTGREGRGREVLTIPVSQSSWQDLKKEKKRKKKKKTKHSESKGKKQINKKNKTRASRHHYYSSIVQLCFSFILCFLTHRVYVQD